MNWETLLILDIPKLKADRLIYTPQILDNILIFGLVRNKYSANVCHIQKLNDNFSIIYYKVLKPKYNHSSNEFTPFEKKEKFRKDELSLEQVKSILTNSFK